MDYEARLASEELDEEQEHLLAKVWQQTFARWREVLDGEGFWICVRERIREVNDIKLTTGIVGRIHNTLPTALLLINAKLAYRAAERAEVALAQRHIRFIRDAGFSNGHADKAIREALGPTRNRIKTLTDRAKSRWTGKHRLGDHVVQSRAHEAIGWEKRIHNDQQALPLVVHVAHVLIAVMWLARPTALRAVC